MNKKIINTKPKQASSSVNTSTIFSLKTSLGIIIIIFSLILYVQSISFSYTFDDFTVTSQNKLVTAGVSGIPMILETDYWYGYIGNIRVPEYRPIPLVLLAIEWQLFPDNPHAYHLINILLFAGTCWLVYKLLIKLFDTESLLFPFICTMLFAAHPIHTEVVDSIKSCDELLCFIFALLAVLFTLKYVKEDSVYKIIIAAVCFLTSLLSKESSISFIVIIPILLFVFTNTNMRKIGFIMLVLIGVSLLFFVLRYPITSTISSTIFNSISSNSLYAADSFMMQKATAFYILGNYIFLLIFPYTLSCDYSFNQIPLKSFTDISALISILFYFAIGIYSLFFIRKKSIPAFAILFFLLTLVPVANIFILIGSTMAERFMYMPSLGFCMVLSWVMIKVVSKNSKTRNHHYLTLKNMISSNTNLFILSAIIICLFSIKTISRNPVWMNDLALFSHDVVSVPNNEKMHVNYGICLYNRNAAEQDSLQKNLDISEDIREFYKALSINDRIRPTYIWLIKCFLVKKDYPDVMALYNTFRRNGNSLDSTDFIHLSEAFYYLGSQETDPKQADKALSLYDSAIKYNPEYAGAFINKGVVYLNKYEPQNAITSFQNAIKIDAKNEIAYLNIGYVYSQLKMYAKALEFLNKAAELDPADSKPLYFIGSTYRLMGDTIKAREFLEKATTMQGQHP